ncbi:histidine kinase [Ignicoccus islandicus DSM 13165]|uniref:Histidine kinase n=1 Tax=Ignicoccus islandicus DSM 13165 TaxID=940295 RepID=A0A0U3F8M2_9CREN|nr:CBS domain-containing protein [Ignicoccus islandicus]ALU11977.1 histidine kinase [Ignicoccus islandicus DSM 13165]
MSSVEKYFGRERLIISIDGDATLGEAAERMHENAIGALLVTAEGGKVVGLITERDIIAALALGADPSRAKVKYYMTPWSEVITITPDVTVEEALKMMLDNGVRHLVVVQGNRVLGILSMRDLCAALMSS